MPAEELPFTCIYVTSGWGVHDERWIDGLRSVGSTPLALSLGRDATSVPELRSLVEEAANSTVPVVAGPLGSIAQHLVGIPAPLIGLSWGYDLHELDETSNTNWLRALDGLIVDSEATASIALKAGVDPMVITMLPWGVDLEVFTNDGPDADLSTFGVPPGAQVVLTARAHEPLYRVGDVIEAFRILADAAPDMHLLIAHQGSLTGQLMSNVRKGSMSDRIHFIGRVAEADLPALMRASSCYVTAAAVDGTSVTLLQAMACGVPVVASDSAGNQGWITDGLTGRLFRTGDTDSLAAVLEQTLDPDQPSTALAALTLVQRDADWTRNLARLRQALARLT